MERNDTLSLYRAKTTMQPERSLASQDKHNSQFHEDKVMSPASFSCPIVPSMGLSTY